MGVLEPWVASLSQVAVPLDCTCRPVVDIITTSCLMREGCDKVPVAPDVAILEEQVAGAGRRPDSAPLRHLAAERRVMQLSPTARR